VSAASVRAGGSISTNREGNTGVSSVAEAVGHDGALPYDLHQAFASPPIHEGRLSVVDIAAQLRAHPACLRDTYAHVMAEWRGSEPVRLRSRSRCSAACGTHAHPRRMSGAPSWILPRNRAPPLSSGKEIATGDASGRPRAHPSRAGLRRRQRLPQRPLVFTNNGGQEPDSRVRRWTTRDL
jgi:hypothetical protein